MLRLFTRVARVRRADQADSLEVPEFDLRAGWEDALRNRSVRSGEGPSAAAGAKDRLELEYQVVDDEER